MLHATFKSLLARKLRLLLSALSIVLGVAFVVGAFVLTDTLGKAFDNLFSTISANVAVDVRGTKVLDGSFQTGDSVRHKVPETALAQIRAIDGVAEAQPGVTGTAQLVGSDGKVVTTGGAPTLGVNWTDTRKLTLGTIEKGRAPHGPQEIALNRSLAETAGYTVGDRATVLTDQPQKSYQVVGIIGFADGAGSLGGATTIFFDTTTAQQVLGRDGVYDDISVAAAPGVSEQKLRDRIAAVLPKDTEAVTGTKFRDEQSSAIKDSLSFFNTFLLVFAAIALFVGAFIIFNTFSMLVGQRTRELALLRALGASRRQVTRSVLLEAVVVGAISSVLGLAAGVGVAKLLNLVFQAAGAEFPSTGTVIALRTVIAAFAVGIVVTSLAALLPARRASKVPPIAALRDANTPDRSLLRQSVAGAVLLAVGAALMTAGLTGRGLAWLGLGTLLAFVGVTMLSPLASRPLAAGIGLLFARALPGRLGRENSVRNPRRTAATASALMVGLALISAVSVLGASLKESVARTVDGAIASDFVLQTDGPGFPDDVLQRAEKVPGVDAVAAVKGDTARIKGDTTSMTAVTPSSIGPAITLVRKSGSMKLRDDTLLVSKRAADREKLGVGDKVTVQYAKGKQTYTVGGTYADNSLVGDYLVSTASADKFQEQRNFAALVTLADGSDASSEQKALEKALASYPNVDVQTRDDFIGEAADQVDQIVTMISILLLLSVIIAILGVVNTLALSVIERTRELGLLRAIGMSRRQMKRMIRVESVVISIFGGLLGLVVGAIFGTALQQALKGQGVTELGFPVGRLIIYLVVAGLAGVLAAWLPARRASRLNVLQAIAAD